MKGIETHLEKTNPWCVWVRSDHCPAMKGIETCPSAMRRGAIKLKRPLPRNEGD